MQYLKQFFLYFQPAKVPASSFAPIPQNSSYRFQKKYLFWLSILMLASAISAFANTPPTNEVVKKVQDPSPAVAIKQLLANKPNMLPDAPVEFLVKDMAYQDSIRELFKLSKLKVQFTGDVSVDKNVSIDVKSVRWNILLGAMLDSYGMKYRFVNNDTVEIFKK